MYFKLIFTTLILVPVLCFSQVRFVDTVSISGYSFLYISSFHKTYAGPTSPHPKRLYFVPASTLRQRSLKKYLINTFSEEIDTVKFVSWQGRAEVGLYKNADTIINPWLKQVTEIVPFYVDQKPSRFGVKDYRVFISFVTIQWLHLRMPGQKACDGFNRPYTLDCWDKAKNRDYDVYLPLKLLELEQGIKLKNGNPVHPKRKR
jgi:hypothetical protein